MANKYMRPIFRQSEDDIERKVNQKIEEQTKFIQKEIASTIEARTKPLEEMAKSFQEDRQEKIKQAEQRKRQDEITSLAEERAKTLAEERAKTLAEERAKTLAEERAKTLAEERAKTLAEEIAKPLVEERAKTLAEERAKTLAEERAKTLAEEIAKPLVEERAKTLAEERAKALADQNKQNDQQKPVQGPSASPPETSSKIAKMIEEIKRRKASTPTPSQIVPQDTYQPQVPQRDYIQEQQSPVDRKPINIPIISPSQAVDDGISCPTCHNGHVHSVTPNGVTYKCTGPDCGKEYVMIDKSSDYKCVNCGVPIKRPENDKSSIDSCPFCNGKKAIKFDWSKAWKTAKPSMSAK